MEKDDLEYGASYLLWRGGLFLGEAVFIADDNIGDSFVRDIMIDGERALEVVIADKWQRVNNQEYDNKEWN
jgi:hypothetical protein